VTFNVWTFLFEILNGIATIIRMTNGCTPCWARISTKYAPSPTYACCPTETIPA
jgi:hypothetical protein